MVVSVAAQGGKLLQQPRVWRPRQHRGEKRIFPRTRRSDFVGLAGNLFTVEIGPQDRAIDAGDLFNDEHAFGWDARPVRHRRLSNADFTSELAHTTSRADSFIEVNVSHLALLF
jgi:hypothetical protein